ncbi:MAG: 30S ribosomal protein S16 [Pseudanabaenaceae cyanobacterium]
MVKLRLKRFGKKGKPTFRIVAMHSTTRRQAIPLEELGFYDPRTKETRLDVEGIKRRLQQGAQPTDSVRRLLEKASILEPIARG